MRNFSACLILLFFLSGCSDSKISGTPLKECLITEGSDDLIVMRIDRYLKEKLNYSRNLTSVASASNGLQRNNHLTSRGRVVECQAILKFEDGSSELGMIKNESWKTPAYALSYRPIKLSKVAPTVVPSSQPSSKGICIGNTNNCSGTKNDEYYDPNPSTPDDIRRNKEYLRNHQTYVCRSATPSYAEGVKVREYIVLDPRECR